MEINGKEGRDINVLLLDDDRDFRNRFSAYIAANCSHIVLSLADGSAGGELQLLLSGNPDLILADAGAGLLEQLVAAGMGKRTVMLESGKPAGIRKDEQGVRYIFKYLGVSSLIASIPELADSYDTVKICRKNTDDLRLSAITGYCGGSGKTSFAVAAAGLNGMLQNRVTLVISTELFPDLDRYFPDAEGPVSDSNLLLLNFLSGFRVVPDRFLLRDRHGSYCLSPPASGPSDLNDLSEDEMANLIRRIQGWEMFDSIIFDTGRGDHRLDRFILNNADTVFIMHDARRPAGSPEKRWLDRLEQKVRSRPLVHITNFCHTAGTGGLPDHFTLPVDPDSFSQENGIREIRLTGRYAQAAGEILKGHGYLL